jgi:predicted ATP-grasp superfamily ATP-dependent carboligase
VPAVVLGKGKNAFGVCRSLGRRGVPVTLVNADPRDGARVSRFCTPVTSPDPAHDPQQCVDFLVGLSTQWSVDPVLIPTGDVEVNLVSRARQRLSERFAFRMADAQIVEALVRKDQFAALARAHGLDVPRTHVVRDMSALDAVAGDLTFPCVLKPVFSPSWRDPSIREALARVTGGRAKRVIARSPEELRCVYTELAPRDPCVVVQEYVEGGDDCLYDVYTYLDANADLLGSS